MINRSRTRWTQSLLWANRLLPLLRFGAWPMPLIDESPICLAKFLAAMGPNKWPPEMARWKWKKTDDLNHHESNWPKMKGLCSFWVLMDSLSAVTNFRGLSKIQLARCHGMPNASEKSNLRLKKSDKLERLLHHPDISSCIFSTFHWSRMALDTQKASTPSSVFGFNTGEDSFRSHDQTERFVFWYTYLLIHICIYIYIHIHGFFLNIVNDSWIVRCSIFYRLMQKMDVLLGNGTSGGCLVIVLTPHVQTSMKGKWVQKLRCMPCCATGVWRYVLM